MDIAVAGGTGFIGQALVPLLLKEGHYVTVIGRDRQKIRSLYADNVCSLTWDEFKSHPKSLSPQSIVINLTGANIGAKRWSNAQKKTILNSRLESTKLLVDWAIAQEEKPRLMNASAIGIYGLQESLPDRLPRRLDESSRIPCKRPPDFLSSVGCQWEAECQPAIDAGLNVIIMRFGVVLGPTGGVLSELKLPFSYCLGGPIGSGQQPFTWVSLVDICQAILFFIAHETLSGPFNITAPSAVTQKDFAKTLGKVMHRPAIMPMPGFTLKMMFGQMAEELLLKGQHVYPKRLTDAGYHFIHSKLEETLQYCFANKTEAALVG